MRNYRRITVTLGILYFLAVLIFALATGRAGSRMAGRDTAILNLNDITSRAADCWDDLDQLREVHPEVDYSVLDTAENVLYATRPEAGESRSLATVQKQGGLYSCVTVNDRLVGYVILAEAGGGPMGAARRVILAGLILIGILLLLAAALFGHYVNKNIVLPFRNMKKFAARIAEGNLDEPLSMDRSNLFGAFTESFDIMREELAASKKREIALARRERELVASLSHDLKTPVTGIKLVCELLQAKLHTAAEADAVDRADLSEKLDNIYDKADQIDVLVSDLLSSTLEELDELKVACTDERAQVLSDLVHKYDDRQLAVCREAPEVLIRIDVRRMGQVIGNILSNSYKYAGTGIEVAYRLLSDRLEMSITDHGPGVPEEELDLITNKFYRGKRWEQSKEEGSGLGLYIAATLMDKMGGELRPVNCADGFRITLTIPFS